MEAKDKNIPEIKTKFQGDQGGTNLNENFNKNIELIEQTTKRIKIRYKQTNK